MVFHTMESLSPKDLLEKTLAPVLDAYQVVTACVRPSFCPSKYLPVYICNQFTSIRPFHLLQVCIGHTSAACVHLFQGYSCYIIHLQVHDPQNGDKKLLQTLWTPEGRHDFEDVFGRYIKEKGTSALVLLALSLMLLVYNTTAFINTDTTSTTTTTVSSTTNTTTNTTLLVHPLPICNIGSGERQSALANYFSIILFLVNIQILTIICK